MASNGIATAVVAGNVTRAPELNQTGRVLGFGVAVNRYEKNPAGEYAETVHYLDVKVLGNRAEPLSRLLQKGERVTVQGDLVQERWQTDAGENRSVVRILAREVVLGGSPREAAKSEQSDDTGW